MHPIKSGQGILDLTPCRRLRYDIERSWHNRLCYGRREGCNGGNNTSTLDSPITLGGNITLASLNGSNNTSTLNLTGVISETGGARSITKTGTQNVNLKGANTFTGRVTISGGILGAAVLANGGQPSSIGQSASDASNLVIADGATLSYIGTAAANTDRRFTLGGGTAGGSLNASGAAGAPVSFTSTAPITLSASGATATTLVLSGTNTNANTLAASLGETGTAISSLVKNDAGTWVLTSPNHSYTGATTINGGTLRVTGSIASSSEVIVNNGATFDAAANQTVKLLTINSSTAIVSAGTLKVGDNTSSGPLTVSNSKLDLTNRALVVDHAPDATFPLISTRDQIISAYNASAPGAGDGNWQGNGITSSLLTTPAGGGKAIGYGPASQILGENGGTFADVQVDGSSVLARYTLTGDANLDAKVDFNDLVALAQNYNSDLTDFANPNATDAWWNHGDFNYDGKVNFNDLVALAQNYNTSLPTEPIPGAPVNFQTDLAKAMSAVPEPGTLGLAMFLLAPIIGRRRRP